MKGTIANFRLARHHQTGNQMVIVVDGIDSKEKAEALVGKSVVYKTESGKEIKGRISAPHGGKGAIRAIFETGMPGQAIAQKVDIN